MLFQNRTVFVIDDDADMRTSVCALVGSMGCSTREFASAEEFLASDAHQARGVAVVDLRMPGMSGLDLQEELLRRKSHLPIIVLTAHARTSTTVRAMRAGAVTMIDKPYHDDDLWDAIRAAMEREELDWAANQQHCEIRERLAMLTTEERQVADMVVAGCLNKVIAHELGLAVRTVDKRRHDVLVKMKAESVAELVRMFLAVKDSV